MKRILHLSIFLFLSSAAFSQVLFGSYAFNDAAKGIEERFEITKEKSYFYKKIDHKQKTTITSFGSFVVKGDTVVLTSKHKDRFKSFRSINVINTELEVMLSGVDMKPLVIKITKADGSSTTYPVTGAEPQISISMNYKDVATVEILDKTKVVAMVEAKQLKGNKIYIDLIEETYVNMDGAVYVWDQRKAMNFLDKGKVIRTFTKP